MAMISLRVEPEVAESLKARAAVEGRSMNDIVNQAIKEYSQNHPVSREAMIRLVRSIAHEDESLLAALAKA